MPAVGIAKYLPDTPTADGHTDDLGARHYTLKFQVQTSSYLDGPRTVELAPGVPRLYTPYVFGAESDQYALARKISSERKGPNSLFWIVTVEYRTFTKSELLQAYEHPLLQLPEVETSLEKFQEPVYAVLNPDTGEFQPCKNTAGQVFDPPPMKDANRLVLTISRNEDLSVLHPSIDVIYTDAVNADDFWGCPPGVWKCQGVTTRREVKQLQDGTLYPYLRCMYKFEAKPTWDLLILNAGAYYKHDVGPEVQKRFFTGDDGHPRIGLLDKDGDALPDGEIPIFLTVQPYHRRPFGPLNLPQSFALVA